jgi:hypothetical protein
MLLAKIYVMTKGSEARYAGGVRLDPRVAIMALTLFAGLPALAQRAIPIVHTWGDLQKAPKLTTVPTSGVKPGEVASKSATFQVGVSSDHTTTYGCVLLYFLGSTGSVHPYTPLQWGDYWLRIDGQVWAESDNWLSYASDPNAKVPAGALFCARVMSFTKSGDHILELIKPPDKFASWTESEKNQWLIETDRADAKSANKPVVLARATIQVKGEPDSLWFPFWTISDFSGGAASDLNAIGERFAIEQVNNPQGYPCLPGPPRPRWYENFSPADFSLPTLMPQKDSAPQVDLKMTDSTLVVTFPSQIEGFFPDEYFLTRWWVNGKIAELDPKAHPHPQMRALGFSDSSLRFRFAAFHGMKRITENLLGAQIWYTHEIHFELILKPEWLGAKKGDRIGMQVLFCPSSFQSFEPSPLDFVEMERYRPVLPPSRFSEISNKIEFTYSGDPLHPQQP